MKMYQAQAAAAGMAQTQPAGSVGGPINMARSVGGSMTNAAFGSTGGAVGVSTGGHFVHQSQPVFTGQQAPPSSHPYIQVKPQQFYPSGHISGTEQPRMMMTSQQQGYPPQAQPRPAHFQQPRMQLPPQQQQMPQAQPPPAPQSNTSFIPGSQATSQPPGPSHFPQAFPSAHPMMQPPPHFPSAHPSASANSANQPMLQQHLVGGRGDAAHQGPGRMMSHAAGVVGGISGAPGSSAFTYGGMSVCPCCVRCISFIIILWCTCCTV